MRTGLALMTAIAPVAAFAQTPPATGVQQPQQAPAPADADEEEEEAGEDVVVTGSRTPIGSAQGDIPPEVSLSPADIRSYGVSSIADLLSELTPQTTSGRGSGGQPVVLLNGRRISSFREISTVPTEAILRVDVLPEEVALKYGYRADQRVVNFVLRRRFRSIVLEVADRLATSGGRNEPEVEGDVVQIGGDARTTIHVERETASALTEAERNISTGQVAPLGASGAAIDQALYRTLLPRTSSFEVNAVHARPIGRALASLNGSVEQTNSLGAFGLPTVSLLTPASGPVLRAIDSGSPLQQRTGTLTTHLGGTVNSDFASGQWRWTVTGNYDRVESRTLTDVGVDATDFQSRVLAGLADPLGAIGPADVTPLAANRGLSTSSTAGLDGLLNGSPFALPAGPVSTAFRVGVDTLDFSSQSYRAGVDTSGQVSRDSATGQLNVDLPIASRSRAVLGAIGTLSLNGNLAVDRLSDFGTLTTTGYGLNWVPFDALRVIASVTDQENAPSAQQLGNPVVTTPNVRVFDYVRGTTATVTTLTGGNPALNADDRHTVKVGLTVKPKRSLDLTLIANYVSASTDNPIANFPAATAAIEAAFPDRFARDGAGNLLRIDSRPINFARQERSEMRWGFNLSLPLKSKLQKQIEAFRAGTGPNPFAGLRPPGGRGGAFGQGAPGAQAGQGGQGAPGNQPAAGNQGAPGAEGSAPAAGGAVPPGQGGPGGFGAGPRGPGGFGGPGGPGGRGGFGGGRFGGGGGGGGAGGRLQFALYHTWAFTERVLVADGGPELDLLNGDAIGGSGGQPRHRIELQTGYFNNGLGIRLSGNFRSATEVRGGTSAASSTGTLNFGSLTTANLRIFADFGQRIDLVRKQPWLRGVRVAFSIDNIANTRQRVTDATGTVPINFQPGYVDPLGRTVRLSVRKLFF